MSDFPVITPNDTLADLATQRAGASRAFARHHLDFCCHGNVTLAETCRKKGLDVDALIREIDAEELSDDSFERWGDRPLPDVIEHLLNRFHAPHKEDLPRLLLMASKVEKVHGDKPACPRGLAALIEKMSTDLHLHMRKEEEILFPMIGRGQGQMAGPPIECMQQEHIEAGDELAKIRELTNDHTPPEGACGTWTALYLGLAEFERELMKHVHLENYVLFPRALNS